ncbi:syndecan-4 isoform X2 [Hippoglossus hippoglossus]|uniref:syndecan-4 isoform X2 n=1 Tax=Hippoglossus hippoglossus TaxID=8267 RepID=UPI00148BE5C5|nr:syndecan-4 isoform X2 [Hippoglossus hippoglossus]
MLRLLLLFLLSASVCTESVRETETWMPMKTTQTVAMSTHSDGLEASGDAQNGSDFGFTDDEDDEDDEDLTYEYDESSGSGDGAATVSPERDSEPSVKPDANDNKIPEAELPVRPTVNEVEQDSNEIPLVRKDPETSEEYPSNVLMAHASDDSIFNKTEVLAAVIAGCAVGLMFAVLLILLLIYRMKKKDEGSYDLGKKPIYKKAPTTEIYA